MAQHREKGKLRNGKVESSIAHKLQEAQDEYDEVTRLCVFRVKSLKEGQCRSLLTQGARHHAAQVTSYPLVASYVSLFLTLLRDTHVGLRPYISSKPGSRLRVKSPSSIGLVSSSMVPLSLFIYLIPVRIRKAQAQSLNLSPTRPGL